MSSVDLQKFIKNLSLDIEAYEEEQKFSRISNPTKELEAYISLDDVIAELYRHYIDAKHRVNGLLNTKGKNDPLTLVAIDALESAECTLQTRLIELRRDRQLRAIVTKRITEAKHALEELKADRKRKKEQEYFARFQRHKKKKEEEKDLEDSVFFLYVLLLVLSQAIEYTKNKLSIVYCFSNASYYKSQNEKLAA
jgi:hypothetical protein